MLPLAGCVASSVHQTARQLPSQTVKLAPLTLHKRTASNTAGASALAARVPML